jgi:hypothetical protein
MRKSIISILSNLYNCVYPDSSCCRSKVSSAAGRRAGGSVFCSPFIKCTVTSKLRCYYRNYYVIGFYRDGTTCVRLPDPDNYREAKNSSTPTRSAPNYTTGLLLASGDQLKPLLSLLNPKVNLCRTFGK